MPTCSVKLTYQKLRHVEKGQEDTWEATREDWRWLGPPASRPTTMVDRVGPISTDLQPSGELHVTPQPRQSVQKKLMLVCEDSLCPRKQPDVSGPGLGEAGHYTSYSLL